MCYFDEVTSFYFDTKQPGPCKQLANIHNSEANALKIVMPHRGCQVNSRLSIPMILTENELSAPKFRPFIKVLYLTICEQPS